MCLVLHALLSGEDGMVKESSETMEKISRIHAAIKPHVVDKVKNYGHVQDLLTLLFAEKVSGVIYIEMYKKELSYADFKLHVPNQEALVGCFGFFDFICKYFYDDIKQQVTVL